MLLAINRHIPLMILVVHPQPKLRYNNVYLSHFFLHTSFEVPVTLGMMMMMITNIKLTLNNQRKGQN